MAAKQAIQTRIFKPTIDQIRSSSAHNIHPPNTPLSFPARIASLSKSGQYSAALRLLRHFISTDPPPADLESSLPSALKACAGLVDTKAGAGVHGFAVSTGLSSDSVVRGSLLHMYLKCGSVSDARKVFEGMTHPTVVCGSAVLAGLAGEGRVREAMEVFDRMRELGIPPNSVTELFRAQNVNLNVVSWTSIIACCVQNGKDVEALELFREMKDSGVEPNHVTIPCVLPACANIAALTHGKTIHGFALRRAISGDVYVDSALVDMYAKCGRIRDARHVFDATPFKNTVSWNTLIGGHAMHGEAEEAIELFQEMQRSGQRPDSISFTCVLSACSQAGLIDEGQRYFDVMQREHKIMPRKEHYACMVNLLGRAKQLEEAHSMIRSMPFEPDACVWGALLSSCRVHGNVSLGELAVEKLYELEPRNPGNYVLLSNIYSSKGMWSEVDRVRETMKRLGLKKNPGCSWIEIKNRVHTLLAGDKSHPQMRPVLERLERLREEMKRSGLFPSTDFVLQDVEEQDKERILCGHSEKLAVGLGLLNTREGTPLRVIKNLRICGDCHTMIKFISMFEGRDISVRDTNRFHHFKNGDCSCRDFW
ncbi:Pentatricopeptide repeat-containing protein [Acorus gramineus]|uniref:Pentatricopeptide repeat-containing protein n=1 Tax=Acorus gramineus TaxID=55184 RepID=A0AAV9ACJ5_ACOGR|nr:Pentatricopeptide repeat-containing protein [Acorus gramineus]